MMVSFSSRTRNIPLGRASVTKPSKVTFASLGLFFFFLGFFFSLLFFFSVIFFFSYFSIFIFKIGRARYNSSTIGGAITIYNIGLLPQFCLVELLDLSLSLEK